jgi:hypothetical protein
MLRTALKVIAVMLMAAGIIASLLGAHGAFVMSLWGVVLLAAMLFERWRYRQGGGTAQGEWRDTDERFVDPETGLLTQVMYNPRTGDRRYRPVLDDEKRA